jgi:hypothetical protein
MSGDQGGGEDRRAFLERAGKTAVMAPAVALLLSAAGRNAMAAQYGRGQPKYGSNNVPNSTGQTNSG